jgi:hypothetical protein
MNTPVAASMKLLDTLVPEVAYCSCRTCSRCMQPLDPAFEAACSRALLATAVESYLIVCNAAMTEPDASYYLWTHR